MEMHVRDLPDLCVMPLDPEWRASLEEPADPLPSKVHPVAGCLQATAHKPLGDHVEAEFNVDANTMRQVMHKLIKGKTKGQKRAIMHFACVAGGALASESAALKELGEMSQNLDLLWFVVSRVQVVTLNIFAERPLISRREHTCRQLFGQIIKDHPVRWHTIMVVKSNPVFRPKPQQ